MVIRPLTYHLPFSALKDLFLASKGDVFVNFMDLAKGELKKRAAEIPTTSLQKFFDTALQASSCSSIIELLPNIVCSITPNSLSEQIRNLSYEVDPDLEFGQQTGL